MRVILCGSGIVAELSKRGKPAMEEKDLPNPLNLDEKTLSSVVSAIKRRHKIEAVKIVQNASKKGLKESKDYVDKLWKIISSERNRSSEED